MHFFWFSFDRIIKQKDTMYTYYMTKWKIKIYRQWATYNYLSLRLCTKYNEELILIRVIKLLLLLLDNSIMHVLLKTLQYNCCISATCEIWKRTFRIIGNIYLFFFFTIRTKYLSMNVTQLVNVHVNRLTLTILPNI